MSTKSSERTAEAMEERGGDVETAMRRRRDRGRCGSWRLVTAVTVPYVVVIACMAFVITTRSAFDDVFIEFETISDILDKETLMFELYHNNSVHLVDNKEIHILCNGPYILHMYVCYVGLEELGQGCLELRRDGTQTLTNLTLEAGKDITCKGLHATVDLRKKEWATFSFFSKDETLKVKNLTVGLRYMLGQCQF